MDDILRKIKKFIPKSLFERLAPLYHYLLAFLGALVYRFPASKLQVIAVTGTKGKSSTTEILNSIFESAGRKTVLLNTIQFKIGQNSVPNKRKMTVPGRFFLQKNLRKAVNAGCDTAVLELSSEAAKQFRNKFIPLDALIFTNLAPEHIESHGSYENYRAAKVSLVSGLKKNGILIVNADDPESIHFINATQNKVLKWSSQDKFDFETSLVGDFNKKNILAAAACARAFGIKEEDIQTGVRNLKEIKGRAQFIKAGQDFDVIVDYAHTSGSLTELYKAFDTKRKICVLGNTGGGRDRWKRPEMARVADTFCDEIILTNEDPYDEDPRGIIEEMLPGFKLHTPTVIMDRREAIGEALKRAKEGDAVLITGKGTDPYIMLANGKKLPWSDSQVAREELEKLLK